MSDKINSYICLMSSVYKTTEIRFAKKPVIASLKETLCSNCRQGSTFQKVGLTVANLL